MFDARLIMVAKWSPQDFRIHKKIRIFVSLVTRARERQFFGILPPLNWIFALEKCTIGIS